MPRSLDSLVATLILPFCSKDTARSASLANSSQPQTQRRLTEAAPTMPPQIKQDLNRSGWETTDFPSVCENCLPENPFVKMLKEDYGAECKLVRFVYSCFFHQLTLLSIGK